MVWIPREELAKVTDPKALLQRAEQLREIAEDLRRRLGDVVSAEDYAKMIQPLLDTADVLTDLAEKIGAAQKKV